MAFFGILRYFSFRNKNVSSSPSVSTPNLSATVPASSLPFKNLRPPVFFEIMQYLEKNRGGEDKQLYHLEDIACAVEESLLKREENRRWKYFVYAIVFFILLNLISSLTVFAILTFQQAKDIQSFIPVRSIFSLEVEEIGKMESLVLQWGQTGTPEKKKFYFKILSAFENAKNKSIIVKLSSNYTLIVHPHEATLYNEKDEEVGVLKADVSEEETNGVQEKWRNFSLMSVSPLLVQESKNGEITSSERRLRKKDGRIEVVGPSELMYESYCRYGCGGMAVTYPFYHRPFHGFGFPLLGLESMFPQGYGGHPAAPILASQAGVNTVAGLNGPTHTGVNQQFAVANRGMPAVTQSFNSANNLVPVQLP